MELAVIGHSSRRTPCKITAMRIPTLHTHKFTAVVIVIRSRWKPERPAHSVFAVAILGVRCVVRTEAVMVVATHGITAKALQLVCHRCTAAALFRPRAVELQLLHDTFAVAPVMALHAALPALAVTGPRQAPLFA